MFNSDGWSSFEHAVVFLLVCNAVGVALIYFSLEKLVRLKKQ